jgi:hypothetical protein
MYCSHASKAFPRLNRHEKILKVCELTSMLLQIVWLSRS